MNDLGLEFSGQVLKDWWRQSTRLVHRPRHCEVAVLFVVVRFESVSRTQGVYERVARVVDAGDCDQEAEQDDANVDGNLVPSQALLLELQMKVTRPNEREHRSSDAANEAHEDGEMRYENGKKESEQDQAYSQTHGPELEIAFQVVTCAHEDGLGDGGGGGASLSSSHDFRVRVGVAGYEERQLDQLNRSKVRQWIRQQCFEYEYEIDDELEFFSGQVVCDDFFRLFLPSEKAHETEESLEEGGNNVRQIQHRVELGLVHHVAFEGWQKDLRRIAEDDDAQ